MGAGPKEKFDDMAVEQFAAQAFQSVKGSGAATLVIHVPGLPADKAARAAFGVKLAAYRFDRYRTREKPEAKPSGNPGWLLSGFGVVSIAVRRPGQR